MSGQVGVSELVCWPVGWTPSGFGTGVHMNDMFRQQQAKKPEGNCGQNNGDTLHCTAQL